MDNLYDLSRRRSYIIHGQFIRVHHEYLRDGCLGEGDHYITIILIGGEDRTGQGKGMVPRAREGAPGSSAPTGARGLSRDLQWLHGDHIHDYYISTM